MVARQGFLQTVIPATIFKRKFNSDINGQLYLLMGSTRANKKPKDSDASRSFHRSQQGCQNETESAS